ncbi:hypothetical protein BDZ88DRAFT_417518 [Geranomyces variabilis]|nr:hypothetical protein BDZ88DRAFT_417518 [Geranomyces variabilis]KAJ3133478.1 hypothetical protein HDU90_005798 [Geranomyces variabilis]
MPSSPATTALATTACLPALPNELWCEIACFSDPLTASSLLLARHWRRFNPTYRRFKLAQLALSRKLNLAVPTLYTEPDLTRRKSSLDAYAELEVGKFLLVRRIVDHTLPAHIVGKWVATKGVIHQRLYVRKEGLSGGWERGCSGERSCFHFQARCSF